MKVIYSDKHNGHNPRYEIDEGKRVPHVEKPQRIAAIVKKLKLDKRMQFCSPNVFSLDHIYDIHQKEYVAFLQKKSIGLRDTQVLYPSYFIMDTYTPITFKTYDAAKSSADVALTGAKYIREGEQIVYVLCRPPGHHAEYKAMGGYCYFNNAAVAANYLSKKGKVVILDIDFHHGNGIQSAFYDRPDVLYISIHADPSVKFPYNSGFANEKGQGAGLGFNKNYPLPLGTTDQQYLQTLQEALKHIRSFNPTFLVISAGFDTYEKDPIGGFKLSLPFYEKMGLEIAKLQLPALIVQEGGYNIEKLGELVISFLGGILSYRSR